MGGRRAMRRAQASSELTLNVSCDIKHDVLETFQPVAADGSPTEGSLMHAQGRRWIARVVVLVAVAAVGATGETQQARADTACPWMNTSLSADQRAQAL